MDESGFDTHQKYSYAWSKRGERVSENKPGGKGSRINIVSCLNFKRELFASFTFEGSCDKDVFNIYTKEILIPVLSEGMTVVLDNASFHKSSDIEILLKEKKCRVMYLPTYSPDLNPIENYWSPIKNDLRKRFLEAVDEPLRTVTEVVAKRSI